MKNKTSYKHRVVELFAGVGGFRVGFNNINKLNKDGSAKENKRWDFVWANQWEPATKSQDAFQIYEKRFGKLKEHVNQDIFQFPKDLIPDHEVLVGGFPCQDYSVARSLSGEKGIEGKKGVLWWEIYKILQTKKPPYVLLENVDRLLKSPSKKRGRDFGIMLACFNILNYNVEWRIINAADYGFPQRRRRVFIFAYKNTLSYNHSISKIDPEGIALKSGLFAKAFKVEKVIKKSNFELPKKDLAFISENFAYKFLNYGYMNDGKVYTFELFPKKSEIIPISKIIENSKNTEQFVIRNNLEKWKYLKGAKKIERTSRLGYKYIFSEGAIPFPDLLDNPARTMLTSEGTLNRSSHIIFDKEINNYRTLTPIETERLNGFPDNWTYGLSNRKRFFMMGNALVCGLVSKLSKTLFEIIKLQ